MSERSADASALDTAISGFLDSTSNDDFARLINFGPAALRRALELAFRASDPDVPPLTRLPVVKGRDAVEAWSSLLAELGSAFPDEFLDQYDRGDLPLANDPLLVISALRGVDGARARNVLAQFAEHPDEIVRWHLMNALNWREDEVARAVVERHLADSSPGVRLNAIMGVARRDTRRARPLLAALVDDERVPPLIRREARTRFMELGTDDSDS
jgi:hypothetical protein